MNEQPLETKSKRFEKASRLKEKAEEANEEINFLTSELEAFEEAGKIAERAGMVKKARKLYVKQIEVWKDKGDSYYAEKAAGLAKKIGWNLEAQRLGYGEENCSYNKVAELATGKTESEQVSKTKKEESELRSHAPLTLRNILLATFCAYALGSTGYGLVSKMVGKISQWADDYVESERKYTEEQQALVAESDKTITATVLEERYENDHYGLKVETEDGHVLGIEVTTPQGYISEKASLEALINKGSIISFPKGNFYFWHFKYADKKCCPHWKSGDHACILDSETYFDPRQKYISTVLKNDYRIKVLKP